MSPSNIVLRSAGRDDTDIVVRLVAAYHEFEGAPPFEHAEIERAVAPLLRSERFGRIWLIVLDGAPIGYIAVCFGYSIEFSGRDAFVDEFFIVPSHRGRGIGRSVLSRIRATAADEGVRALHLEVSRDNTPARALYRSLGFEARERFMLMSARLGVGD